MTTTTELSYNREAMKDWTSEDIRALRNRFNLTQEELADLLGVTRVYVGMLERKEKMPSKTLKLLLNFVEKDLTTKQMKDENGERGEPWQRTRKTFPKEST